MRIIILTVAVLAVLGAAVGVLAPSEPPRSKYDPVESEEALNDASAFDAAPPAEATGAEVPGAASSYDPSSCEAYTGLDAAAQADFVAERAQASPTDGRTVVIAAELRTLCEAGGNANEQLPLAITAAASRSPSY